MAGPATRLIDGQSPGWNGHVRTLVAVTKSDVTVYDPPLRTLVVGGAGNLALVIDGDDETDASKRFVIAAAANERIEDFAIRQVRSTSTTATSLIGFR